MIPAALFAILATYVSSEVHRLNMAADPAFRDRYIVETIKPGAYRDWIAGRYRLNAATCVALVLPDIAAALSVESHIASLIAVLAVALGAVRLTRELRTLQAHHIEAARRGFEQAAQDRRAQAERDRKHLEPYFAKEGEE